MDQVRELMSRGTCCHDYMTSPLTSDMHSASTRCVALIQRHLQPAECIDAGKGPEATDGTVETEAVGSAAITAPGGRYAKCP